MKVLNKGLYQGFHERNISGVVDGVSCASLSSEYTLTDFWKDSLPASICSKEALQPSAAMSISQYQSHFP